MRESELEDDELDEDDEEDEEEEDEEDEELLSDSDDNFISIVSIGGQDKTQGDSLIT